MRFRSMNHGDHIRGRQMHDVDVRPVLIAKAQKERDRFILCRSRTRLEPSFIPPSRRIQCALLRSNLDGPWQLCMR
jgi:hypothetical protein